MIRNYFKIALRNLWKHKAFSLINILGLTVGLTAGFLIFSYVFFERSYDTFHSKADRIYRVVANVKTPTELIEGDRPAFAVGPHIKQDFAEIEHAVRVITGETLLIRKGDKKFVEAETMYADTAFFNMFDFPLTRGDRNTALAAPYSVVLSESAAKKYFGSEDPMGQTLLITEQAFPARVTGIMKDIPENSQINGDLVISMTTFTQDWLKGADDFWGSYWPLTYIQLQPGADAKHLEKQLPAFLEKHAGTEMKKSQMYATLFLEPLKDVYLRSSRGGPIDGNINNVNIFSIVAIFILVIACINFVNLTTARSSERAREVGIRKVVGALKRQLTGQFIGESLVLCFIACVLTVLLAALLTPSFNQLAGKTVIETVFAAPGRLLLLFACALGIGLLAGIYPALILSSFRPVSVLKGRFATGRRGIALRKALVVTQFTISIALIIGTIVVYRQMSFMRNKELGFKKDQMLVINAGDNKNREAFAQAVAGMPAVRSVATSNSVPGGSNPNAYTVIENRNGDKQVANLDLYFVDFDYIPHYQIQMVAGRPFSREFLTDSTQSMILNEAAVKMFGYTTPEDAIGKRFEQWGREGKIIGVMKDFHFRSLQLPIKPLSMRIEQTRCNLVSVNVSTTNLPATIAAIEQKWNELIPSAPFSYTFLDEFFNRQYRDEVRFGKLFLNFAILAIFISCLGLLGLASYSTLQRTREIGIRKVMGASVTSILHLLSRDFLKLVLIAFFVAAPVAWYFMHQWLEDFAYRTAIAWWIFALAGVLALLIALFTISFMALRAAVANPVKSLRSE